MYDYLKGVWQRDSDDDVLTNIARLTKYDLEPRADWLTRALLWSASLPGLLSRSMSSNLNFTIEDDDRTRILTFC